MHHVLTTSPTSRLTVCPHNADQFGLPLTIKPNFADKSCDFYFGKTPPPIENDDALLFGCNSLCKTGQDVGVESVACHKLRPYEGAGAEGT